MIALLIDAAIALVTILDRACSAVEAARLQANPPSPVEDVHVPPGPGQRNEPAPAGHPATVRNAHAEPLRWERAVIERDASRSVAADLQAELDEARDRNIALLEEIRGLIAERDETRAERDSVRWRVYRHP